MDPLVLKFAAVMMLAAGAGAPAGVTPVFGESPESEALMVTMGDWVAEYSVEDVAAVIASLLETYGESADEEAVAEELADEMASGESGLEAELGEEPAGDEEMVG